jgi:ankyrin repeat protein
LDANPNQKIGNSENLIAFACEHYHPMICHLLGYLIKECRMNPDQCLYSALNTENPSIELVSFLIKNCSADPNGLLKKISPLWLAIKRRHFDLIQPLIELGADPHMRSTSYQRFSILHALATKQDAPLELFEFLVNECQMDPLAVSERGVTALSLADGANKEKLLELIEKNK